MAVTRDVAGCAGAWALGGLVCQWIYLSRMREGGSPGLATLQFYITTGTFHKEGREKGGEGYDESDDEKSTKDAETGLRDPGDVVGVGEGEVDAADEEVKAVGAPGGYGGEPDGHAHQAHYGKKAGGRTPVLGGGGVHGGRSDRGDDETEAKAAYYKVNCESGVGEGGVPTLHEEEGDGGEKQAEGDREPVAEPGDRKPPRIPPTGTAAVKRTSLRPPSRESSPMTVLVMRGTLTMAMMRPMPIRKWVTFAPEKVACRKSRGSMRGWGMRFSLSMKPAARARERAMPRAARGGESAQREMDRVRMIRASMSQKPPR